VGQGIYGHTAISIIDIGTEHARGYSAEKKDQTDFRHGTPFLLGRNFSVVLERNFSVVLGRNFSVVS